MTRKNHNNGYKNTPNLIEKSPEKGIEITLKSSEIIVEICIECGAILEFISDKFTDNLLITELFEKYKCPDCGCEFEFDSKIIRTKIH